MSDESTATEAPAATENTGSTEITGNLPGWYVDIGGGVDSLSDSTFASSSSGTTPGLFADFLDTIGLNPVGGILDGVLCGLLGQGPFCVGTTITSASETIKYSLGTALNFGLGYRTESGLRPELTFAYRSNDVDSASLTTKTSSGASSTVNATSASGKVTSLSAMGNLWYDILPNSRVQPYVGAGVGGTRLSYDNVSATFGSGATAISNSIDSDKTAFAYQLGAGVGFKVTPRTTIDFDYRYFVASDVELPVNNTTLKTDYKSHTAMLGLRYLFASSASKCPNTPEGVAVDSEGCPLDSDGDGIPDYLDKCPGTPPGAQVGADGCELDSDGDGVPDSRDQCPETPAGVSVDDKGCPLDSDGDGVPDYLDKCPNTAPGTLVDAEGCPAADQDGDGIPDYLDKCPNTPKGVPVGPDGCPLDSDGDGIPDYLDECPHSPAGAKVLPNGCAPVGDCRKPRPGEEVDENGCAVEKRFILRGVKFEFDSDRLTPEAKTILNGVASTLNNYVEISVELAGHTDNIGSDAYNLGLSERRSNSVKNYLTGKGVDANRMTPVGYGLTQPIASNDTEEGREENRRVELKVIE